MNLIRSLKSFLVLQEELNDAQKRKVQSWLPKNEPLIRSNEAEKLSGHIIPVGEHAIRIPATPTIMNRVREHLQNNGHDIYDYEKGLAKDKYGRSVKLGTALTKTKAPQDLIDSYASDDRKSAADMDNHEIIISRHPYHVAEGSTDKAWKSCAALTASGLPCRYGGGAAARKLPDEIREGTHVAYLVPKGVAGKELSIQQQIDKAKARVYLKPHTSSESGHKVLIPEKKVYSGNQGEGKNQGFLDSVREFTNKNFPMNPGELYYKNNKVYDDDATSRTPKFDDSEKSENLLMDKMYKPEIRRTIANNSKSPKLISHLIQHYDNDDDMSILARNSSLTDEHIGAMLDRNKPNIDYGLSLNPKLKPEHIDKILQNNPSVETLSNLAKNKSLNTDQIDKIFSSSEKTLSGYPTGSVLKNLINHNLNKLNDKHIRAALRGGLRDELIPHSELNSSHLDKILELPHDPFTLDSILRTHSNKLDQQHLHKIIDNALYHVNYPHTHENMKHAYHDVILRATTHPKINAGHLDNIINNTNNKELRKQNKNLHYHILRRHSDKLSNETLHSLIDKWKNDDNKDFTGNPAALAQDELINRRRNQLPLF
jgi:DNA-binding phage protein